MAAPRPREVIYYLAMSLDGFIAGPNHEISWLDPYPATDVGYDEFFAGVDGVVMGRRTYEIILRLGDWPLGARPTAVATRRPLPDPQGAAFAIEGTPDEMLSALYERGAKGRIFLEGGGDLAGQFLKAGQIDTLEIAIIPALLGSGIPLFRGAATPQLDLVFAKPLKNGIVQVQYRLKPASR